MCLIYNQYRARHFFSCIPYFLHQTFTNSHQRSHLFRHTRDPFEFETSYGSVIASSWSFWQQKSGEEKKTSVLSVQKARRHYWRLHHRWHHILLAAMKVVVAVG
ncbi:hypothetical protein Hanom_Chr15g01339911 [Helianthus anomalus]